jgi:AcrR family transcriptional regulator
MSNTIQPVAKRKNQKSRSDAVENRERVLVAAREVFAENGIHALIPDIALRAGVGNGTVYRHFLSKEALIRALLEEYWSDIDLLRVQSQEMADPWVGFTLLMRGMLQIQDERLWLCNIVNAPEHRTTLVAALSKQLDETLITLFLLAQEANLARQDLVPSTIPLIKQSLSASIHASHELHIDWEPYFDIVLNGLKSSAQTVALSQI